MDFVALDVETANPDMASICQFGLVQYVDGHIKDELASYIDPQDYFDPFNVDIHGIDEGTVAGAPTMAEFAETLHGFLDGRVAVIHTAFDRGAIQQACVKRGIRSPECAWLDSARIARRAWTEFATSGYGLKNVCGFLGYEFQHHDALEDARAAGFILLEASKKEGLDVDGWLKRVQQPINAATPRATYRPVSKDGNPDGPLFGEVVVFTGALTMVRHEAADMAAKIGCQVAPSVTKKRTLLVVGDQDISKLAGHTKSSKHRKAEDLIRKGVPIRLLKESDFLEIVTLYT
jgi:DNA polymerase-3 subunit epsilon